MAEDAARSDKRFILDRMERQVHSVTRLRKSTKAAGLAARLNVSST
jgi:hypothetical protein